RTALEMQAVHQQIQVELKAQGIELPDVGIGVSTGELIAGEMGSPVRTDFTVMGRSMNLGARLCSAAKGGEICMSEATYDLVKNRVDASLAPLAQLKGLGDVPFYHLLKLKGS
ncbi:MAG TPA: adenylate/guanylate cyclase domain-containing protein, partial [Phototrophicaceae bacterium]|nr:adenylate/guanylate cyclase domain-containing protein [Phototrophicaceae bacterium]